MHRSLPGEIIQVEVSPVKAESTTVKTKELASSFLEPLWIPGGKEIIHISSRGLIRRLHDSGIQWA